MSQLSKPLILASASPQRKKLLKLLGLKFKILPSQAEEFQKVTSTCSALVKKNALLKAEDIASQCKQGVVIGSDTLVSLGNRKIFGKPKDLKEAKNNLKILMSKPQWIYTGVAVIDIASNRRLIDYEKTKVFMNKMSDKQIDRYYERMCPLDKAGGFDIEGLGSSFISRIEGCYFNVVGLPLAKLTEMLKQVGINVI